MTQYLMLSTIRKMQETTAMTEEIPKAPIQSISRHQLLIDRHSITTSLDRRIKY